MMRLLQLGSRSLVLTFCWREWRAQRGVLIAYTLLGLLCLCLGFSMVPEHWWEERGRRAMALSWFVALGVIGVVAFVAPALVRGEYGSKNDQFVRRLPGALRASFAGKLLFLVLTTAALPLLTLLCGQGFLLAIDEPWHRDLFVWEHNGNIFFEWPWPAVACGYALLLMPWVWAIGTWLPSGRMALGGTILLVLVIGVGIFAVLRQSPGIEKGIAWQSWLWAVPVVGLLAAFASWTKGRRGGGALRSARFGLAAVAVGLVPPSLWLAERTWHYHHPDLQRLATVDVRGLSPDGQFALVSGAGHRDFAEVAVRVDLRDGSATQLTGIYHHLSTELQKPYAFGLLAQKRYWRLDEYDPWSESLARCCALDLTTGEGVVIPWDQKLMTPTLPTGLAVAVAEERRASTLLRAPLGKRVWFEGTVLCWEGEDDAVSRLPWPGEQPVSHRAAGHGMQVWSRSGRSWFDLTTRRPITNAKDVGNAFFVRGTMVFDRSHGSILWQRREATGEPVAIAALQGCCVLGLFDDDHLLCGRQQGKDTGELFLWCVADGARQPLAVPSTWRASGSVYAVAPMHECSSLLARDPAGRIWLSVSNRQGHSLWSLDTSTLAIRPVSAVVGAASSSFRLLQWLGADAVLVSEGAQILRVDLTTGARTVFFPRPN